MSTILLGVNAWKAETTKKMLRIERPINFAMLDVELELNMAQKLLRMSIDSVIKLSASKSVVNVQRATGNDTNTIMFIICLLSSPKNTILITAIYAKWVSKVSTIADIERPIDRVIGAQWQMLMFTQNVPKKMSWFP